MSHEQIFYANSTYSTFCYLLQNLEKEPDAKSLIDKTLFIVGPAVKDIRVPDENKITFDEQTPVQALNKMVYEKTGDKELPWYINARAQFAEHFIKTKKNVSIVSDGLSDHDTFPELVTFPNVKKCCSTTDILGGFNHEKVETFDVKNLWEGLSKEKKQAVSNIFNVSPEALEKVSSRPVLLITQPVSEDNMMDESEKIELYRRIIGQYGEENVILKPHPREKTNWNEIFPGMPVIPRQIPMELLSKMAKLERVATFFSTAAFGTLPDDKVDFYAADFARLNSYHPDTLDSKGHRSLAVSDVEATYRPSKKCNWLRIPDKDGTFYRDVLDKKALWIQKCKTPSK